MAKGARLSPWFAWVAVVFLVFNSCAGHAETWQTGEWLSHGTVTPGPTLAVRAIRAACNDDGDINRFLAYVNATLGRPYQAHYVRTFEKWREELELETKDYMDPSVVPPVYPERPLVPYRDFSVEYPPGFFAFAIPPALLSNDLDVYRVAFSALMGVLLTMGLWLCREVADATLGPEKAARLLPSATWAALAAGVILVRRYDAAVSLALCALVWGCYARKPTAVGIGMGLGIAAKGVPILVAPLAFLFWLTRGRGREALHACLAAVGVGLTTSGPFLLLAGKRMLDLFAYHGDRPLEIESTGGALLILGRLVAPASATLTRSFGSSNVVATWDGPVRLLGSLGLLSAMVYAGVWAWTRLRREHDDGRAVLALARAACAVMVAWMVFGKVLSPQYVTWLLPLGTLASITAGKWSERLFVATMIVTQVIYPFAFKAGDFAEALNPAFGGLILLRNGVLMLWGGSLLRAP